MNKTKIVDWLIWWNNNNVSLSCHWCGWRDIIFFNYTMFFHDYTALTTNITDYTDFLLLFSSSRQMSMNLSFPSFPFYYQPLLLLGLVQNMHSSSNFPPLPCLSVSLHSSPSFSSYLSTMATGDVGTLTGTGLTEDNRARHMRVCRHTCTQKHKDWHRQSVKVRVKENWEA